MSATRRRERGAASAALRLCAILSLAVLLWPGSATAQETTRLSVAVRDDKGAAVPGVTVQALCDKCDTCPSNTPCDDRTCCDRLGNKWYCCVGQVATTDEDGVATLTLRGVNFRIRASGPGFATVERQVEVTPGQSLRVELVFGETGDPRLLSVLSGLVTDMRDTPLREVVVEVAPNGCDCKGCPPPRPGCGVTRRNATDQGGLYRLDLPPGLYDIRFIKDGRLMGSLRGFEVKADKRARELDARIEDPASPL